MPATSTVACVPSQCTRVCASWHMDLNNEMTIVGACPRNTRRSRNTSSLGGGGLSNTTSFCIGASKPLGPRRHLASGLDPMSAFIAFGNAGRQRRKWPFWHGFAHADPTGFAWWVQQNQNCGRQRGCSTWSTNKICYTTMSGMRLFINTVQAPATSPMCSPCVLPPPPSHRSNHDTSV